MGATPAAHLRAISGLVEAESPFAWAFDNLTLVGRGEAAGIFAHPDRDDIVVRVSDYPDGWFAFASLTSAAGARHRKHFPKALEMLAVGDSLIASCERLTTVDSEDHEAVEWIEIARQVLQKGDFDGAAAGWLAIMQPDLISALRSVGRRLTDLRDSNWMLRGRDLVLNDPIGTMSANELAWFRSIHAVELGHRNGFTP